MSFDTSYSDGTDMLREELKFARFIIRLQNKFSEIIKESFITHLKFRGYWDEFKLKKSNICIKMNEPTHFNVLREQQIFEIRSNNYNAMAASPLVSETYAQKKYLGWDDATILANRGYLRREKEFIWELSQTEQFGPEWRKQAEKDVANASGSLDGSGPVLGPSIGGDTGVEELPETGEETPETNNLNTGPIEAPEETE